MKNAFEYEAELAALRGENRVLQKQLGERWTDISALKDTVERLADAERLLTRARIYTRGEFRDEIDACLKELNK